MATPRDWIKRTLRILQVTATGETPSADEMTDGLSALNAMLDSWSNQGLLIPSEQREEFDLVAGQASYSFGQGGDFDSARPLKIDRAAVMQDDAEIPVEILNQDDWAMITVKTTQSTLPTKIYLTGSYPTETVKVWPVPSLSSKLVIYSKKPLSRYASVNTTVTLPEGYEEAVIYNLARRIAPEYGKQLDPSSMQIADSSLTLLKVSNHKPLYMVSDVPGATHGAYNVMTGEYE